MSNQTTPDLLNETNLQPSAIPKALNVLTILTFIGSAINLLLSLASPFFTKMGKSFLEQASSMQADMTPDKLAELEKARQAIQLAEANMVPMVVLGILGAVGCTIGAIWMRKFKKDGFTVYVASQVVPIVGSAVLMGEAYFASWQNYIWLLIPIVFIFLYAKQRKYLVK